MAIVFQTLSEITAKTLRYLTNFNFLTQKNLKMEALLSII